MISSSSPSDYTEESPATSENESIISGFTDDNICGEGATCRVYQMNLQGLHVAVKRLREEYLYNPTFEAAFRKEYSIGRQLKHDALPVYRDMRAEGDNVYIIMDFVDGNSLSELLETEEGRRYFSSPDNVGRFLSELVGAVGYLHRKGVIHCDIKPANIMMRHSDRGLMLIDLDKAYCDTLDRTHGGTSGFSNPEKQGEKPTARKDYAAVGTVLDYIAENTTHFPGRRFRFFRRECDKLETSPEKLFAALRAKSHTGLWLGGIVLLLAILFGIGYHIFKTTLEPEDGETSGVRTYEEFIDSVTSQKKDTISQTQSVPETQPLPQAKREPRITVTDIDIRMADFINLAEESFTSLRTGLVSDDQIRDMIEKIVTSYTSNYHAVLSEFQAANPDVSGFDVELDVARLSEKSRAFSIMQQFSQAARDTIVARNPEFDSDK